MTKRNPIGHDEVSMKSLIGQHLLLKSSEALEQVYFFNKKSGSVERLATQYAEVYA